MNRAKKKKKSHGILLKAKQIEISKILGTV